MSEPTLPARFRDFVGRKALFQPEDKLLLAVSAGLDSTVLAHLLREEGYQFALAHCNFRLRGEDSDRDAAFVRELAAALQVPLHETTLALLEQEAGTLRIQLRARVGRYKYFKKILDEYNYDALLTAHHLDDALETTLMNLVRGTGLSGLRGIPPRTAFPTVRPLLEASREEILAYAGARDIAWREDRSNTDRKYRRNALRMDVVPVLREMGLTDQSLRQTLSHLRSAERLYRRAVAREPGFEQKGEVLVLDRTRNQLGGEDTLTVLREMTGHMGFTDEQYRQMLEISGNARISSATHVAHVSPGRLRLAPLVDTPLPCRIQSLPAEVSYGRARFSLQVTGQPLRLDEKRVQYAQLPDLPLHLRPRQPGDRFEPLGMPGSSKKVSDFFIDAKVPAWDRDRTPILTDAAGTILMIVGHRIADAFALTGEEEEVLRVERLK